jgi:hypothetical protein
MREKISTRRDPNIEAIFLTTWRAIRGVALPSWKLAVAYAFIPAILAVALRAVAGIGPGWAVFLGVYLASVAWSFSWYLRACLHALHPDAPGAKIGLEHYVWRVALAWALTMLPAGFAVALVEGAGIDPASALIILVTALTAMVTIGAMTLAAVTSAQVAVTGRFNPLAAFAVTRGHRIKSIYGFLIFLACAAGIGSLLMLPAVGLAAIGLPEPVPALLAIWPLHLVLLLGLAATSIAILERATKVDAMHAPASLDAG